ncbi:oligosaccharide flippase family protein [uncultured Tateyamaria sp.]|uniref:oligosaccharide flippase family protein n=1 Tax=uncultured Tateyamaria sp. TaxID=455651 RepID=UPI0026130744|nr:oligosaccharide flippase family protein [uncultured Tateyamaria sp.]
MTTRLWSFALQWARVGIAAAVFLVATRFLTLAEIGLFATAIAPVRLTQGLHKAGIGEAVIIQGKSQRRRDALFAMAVMSGLLLSVLLASVGFALQTHLLTALAAIPALNGFAAVSEGLLRRRLALRALALRTIAVQTIAATITLWLLICGAGAWALASFALLNAGLSCGLSIWLAGYRPKSLPNSRYQSLLRPLVIQITIRDLLTNAQFPLAQLAIGLSLGMTAAGAFQIATRMLNLIEALTLSPLRFIALPQLRRATDLRCTLRQHLRLNATLAAWIWGGTVAAAPNILALVVGTEHASAVSPILRALALTGLLAALWMPMLQALTATGHTRLVLKYATVGSTLAVTLVTPTLLLNPTLSAASLSVAALITSLWFLPNCLRPLQLTCRNLSPIAAPLIAGGLMAGGLLLIPVLNLATQVLLGTVFYAAVLYAGRKKVNKTDTTAQTAPRRPRNAV